MKSVKSFHDKYPKEYKRFIASLGGGKRGGGKTIRKYKKKTSIGKTKSSIKLSSMNKDKKRSYKPSRGQGKAA